MYFVYIVECKDGTLYTGITTNIERRLQEHKNGTGSKYTRARKIQRLLYSEQRKNRSSASKREAEIKRLPRAKKIALTRTN